MLAGFKMFLRLGNEPTIASRNIQRVNSYRIQKRKIFNRDTCESKTVTRSHALFTTPYHELITCVWPVLSTLLLPTSVAFIRTFFNPSSMGNEVQSRAFILEALYCLQLLQHTLYKTHTTSAMTRGCHFVA